MRQQFMNPSNDASFESSSTIKTECTINSGFQGRNVAQCRGQYDKVVQIGLVRSCALAPSLGNKSFFSSEAQASGRKARNLSRHIPIFPFRLSIVKNRRTLSTNTTSLVLLSLWFITTRKRSKPKAATIKKLIEMHEACQK